LGETEVGTNLSLRKVLLERGSIKIFALGGDPLQPAASKTGGSKWPWPPLTEVGILVSHLKLCMTPPASAARGV
jgi:hypothetical protein